MLGMLHLLLCRHFATCTAHDAAQTLAHTHKTCAAGRIDFFFKGSSLQMPTVVVVIVLAGML